MTDTQGTTIEYVVGTDTIIPISADERARWRLRHDIQHVDHRVPAGFTTDGASVPRAFWPIFPPVGTDFVAAIVHDHALASGLGWKHSNRLFDRAMRELGVRPWRRVVMVNAVRLNGAWQHLRARLGLGARYVN